MAADRWKEILRFSIWWLAGRRLCPASGASGATAADTVMQVGTQPHRRDLYGAAPGTHTRTRNTHEILHAQMRASVYHGGANAAIGAHTRKQLQQVCSRTGGATSPKQPHMNFSFGFALGDDPQNLPSEASFRN